MNHEVNGQVNGPQLPSILTEEEIEQINEMEWAETDPNVRANYSDELVAVFRRQVVAHGHDLGDVLSEAERVTGLPKNRIAVTTIPGPSLLQS